MIIPDIDLKDRVRYRSCGARGHGRIGQVGKVGSVIQADRPLLTGLATCG